MTFEKFKEMVDLMVTASRKKQQAYDLGIDLYEAFEENEALVNRLWDSLLTEEGLDWFNWFMYEKDYLRDGVGKLNFNATDNGTPICEDLNGLYEYLTKNNYFKIPVKDAEAGN